MRPSGALAADAATLGTATIEGESMSATIWVRNMYTGPGGGAYTGPGGGLYTGPGGGAYTGPGGGAYTGPGGGLYSGPGGGLYTGPGGGMYTGPDSNPYMAITPPWPEFAVELRRMGMTDEANLIDDALASVGWRA